MDTACVQHWQVLDIAVSLLSLGWKTIAKNRAKIVQRNLHCRDVYHIRIRDIAEAGNDQAIAVADMQASWESIATNARNAEDDWSTKVQSLRFKNCEL